MSSTENLDATRALELVRRRVSEERQPGASLPDDDVDVVKAGVVDSMGWVGILSSIEHATGLRNFGAPWPEGRSQSIRSLVEVILESPRREPLEAVKEKSETATGANPAVSLLGWGSSLGSLTIEVEKVERECGLPAGALRERAGIHSVRRADGDESEVVLGQRAAELALSAANLGAEDVDVVVATSATFLNFPSLAAVLHARLLLREASGALDVGGACVGMVHGLATAKALLSTFEWRVALVVASEVNSRRLALPQVPGEFRGLFGDGACAFVLVRSEKSDANNFRLRDFIWGCSGASASSLRLALEQSGELDVQFKGEQLAAAAVTQLDRVIDDLEILSGKPRAEVDGFAIHEPNPRVVDIFAQRAKIPLEKIALISKTCGNLGSATCGVSLSTAMSKAMMNRHTTPRPLVFIAAVGPGLIRAGGYLY